jgi:DNA-directed RNA polymerase subunit RPC12/RpoP
MFCEKCGNKINESDRFCDKCGSDVLFKEKGIESKNEKSNYEYKWWFRLAKVIYIFFYLLLIPILALVWSANSSTISNYNYYTKSYDYTNTVGNAGFASFWTLIIYVVILRLIKISFLYIFFGQKPQWKKEFKKLW